MADRKGKQVYKVLFTNQGRVFEIYAKRVSQGEIFGFVELDGLELGTRDSVVIDPAEEALEREFKGVKRTLVPMHAVIRIDEVEKHGPAKIRALAEVGGKIEELPAPVYTPPRPG